MAVFLSPISGPFFLPGSNTPATGGKVFTYQAGTTTKQTSYTTNSTVTAWANPLILDSGGNFGGSNEQWFTGGQAYKVVLAPFNDTDPPASPNFTWDNVSGINDVTQVTGIEWISFSSTPVFSSVGSFVVSGDQTQTFTAGRRTKTTNSGGTVFSTITSTVFAASTTVGVVNDSSVLDAGLSAVSYGILSTPNGSVPWTNITATGFNDSIAIVSTGPLTVLGNLNVTTGAFNIASTGSLNISVSTARPTLKTGILDISSTSVLQFVVSSATPLISSSASTITVAGALSVQGSTSPSTSGVLNLPYITATALLSSKSSSGTIDLRLLQLGTLAVGLGNVLSIGQLTDGIIVGNTITFSTAPSTLQIAAGQWALWRNTATSTTQFYYNNAGTMVSSAVFT